MADKRTVEAYLVSDAVPQMGDDRVHLLKMGPGGCAAAVALLMNGR